MDDNNNETNIREIRLRESAAYRRQLDANTEAMKSQAETLRGFAATQEKLAEQGRDRETRACDFLRCMITVESFLLHNSPEQAVDIAFEFADAFLAKTRQEKN